MSVEPTSEIIKSYNNMKNNFELCVDLKTVLQNDAQVAEGKCYNGTLSRTDDDHYLFEESVTTSRQRRNPKAIPFLQKKGKVL